MTNDLADIVRRARDVALDYRQLTGRPLGIVGELGEVLAAQELGLTLAGVREPGFDATDDRGRRLQIKSRALPDTQRFGSQRVPSIRLQHEFDAVLLVLLDADLILFQIWEAERADIAMALTAPGSRARNERGALAVSKFKSIGRQVWSREPPAA